MSKEEFSEFHRLLAIIIYEYNKMFHNYNLSDESKSEIGSLLKALAEVQKIVIVDEGNK